jgi:hypothetical protein
MSHVRECSWTSAGSCKLLLFADADATRGKDVCKSPGMFSAARAISHGEGCRRPVCPSEQDFRWSSADGRRNGIDSRHRCSFLGS